MAIHVKVSGAWKESTQPSVRVGGAWKAVHQAYVRVSGTWKPLLAGATIASRSILGTSSAGYELNADGIAYEGVNGSYSAISGEWLLAGSASDFEVRATLNSGTTPSGTLGSWVALSTTRTWELSAPSGQVRSCELTVEIRRASDSTVVATATITIDADNT